MEFKLAQGCTSLVIGNCGFSTAPNRPGQGEAPGSGGLFGGLSSDWTDLAGYLDAVSAAGPAVSGRGRQRAPSLKRVTVTRPTGSGWG